MSSVSHQPQIIDGLRQDISDCLGVDIDDIKPESTFFSDLDGESIDVIDLMFRCEKRFGVRIELQSLLSDLKLDEDGRISEDGVQQLQIKAPEIDWAARVAATAANNPRDILTVDLINELIRRAMK